MRRTLTIADRAIKIGIREIWPQRRDIPNQMWNTFTASAQSEVWLLGIAELGFAQDITFHQIVANGAARGCCYRFLILDPNSTAAAEIDRKEGGGEQVQGRIRRSLRQFLIMQEASKGKRGSCEVRIYPDAPRLSIVRSDEELLVTQYMTHIEGDSCLSLRIQNVPGGNFEVYVRHFEEIWKSAKAPTLMTERGQDG